MSPRRLNVPPEAARVGQLRGHDTQRRHYLARVHARLRVLLEPFADRVPLDELLAVGVEIRERAIQDGYDRCYRGLRRRSQQRRALGL